MKKNNLPIIITFIGPVGAGKSTQIKLLASYLRSEKRKTTETYIKSAHGFNRILSFIINEISNISLKAPGKQTDKLRRRLYVSITPLWNLSETVNIIGKFFFRVYLPFQLGYDVLIEEGLIMSMENYRLFRPHFLGIKASKLPFLDVLLRWVNSHKHLDIILDVSDEEADRRRKSRTFRRSESEDYLSLQRIVISKLRGPNLLIVETSGKPIKEIHKVIVEYLMKNRY
jgi:thymidylate kinase